MSESYKSKTERLGREAIGLTIYQMLVGFAFLVAAFSEFPGHKATLALGYLVFWMGLGSLLLTISAGRQEANRLLDLGERTTRWTIAIAGEWTLRGAVPAGNSFWEEIHNRVRDELADLEWEEKKTPWWAHIGLVFLNLLGRIIGSLLSIGVAWVLTPGY